MTTTTVTLIPATVYGTPSGNYDGSSADFVGDPQKAANYYRGRGGVQTLQWNLDGAQALITVQATLDADPATVQWFDIAAYGNTTTPVTAVHSDSVLGNFTWLRAAVTDFAAGNINSVTATY
jgi:hypothetical protein